MYVRFVVDKPTKNARSRLGIIHAADQLRYEGRLDAHEENVLADALKWLAKNLAVPSGINSPGRRVAISWFKDTATDAIDQMWSIASILREHGLFVEVVRTDNPGKILYQDDQQVFAVPLKDRNASA